MTIAQMDPWLIPDWPAPTNVHARVTTRQTPGISAAPHDLCNLGNRCGDDDAAVASNRASLKSLFNLPADPRWLRQVHGIGVMDADASNLAVEPQADAAVSRSAAVVLAVLSADCLPVLFCSSDGREVAAAHAGWRGLAAGVLEATLASMQSEPGRILTWLGPSIGPASYEIGEEVRQAFVDHDPASDAAFKATRPGRWQCDLPALARLRLRNSGVAEISGGGFDTRRDRRFYSYRRDPLSGRFASLIWRSDF
ncbi:MAG TPA: peptidoglycan editing factor PgeF [Dokdonella sp.]|uniref:peptidoglycan editing factor PgeF n=1 Tax=Dokdonella sp. TaxID=2291710 RepID=UPI002D7F5B57|nr:peptidoglycan editing factor PgeF [Dokdonella sp.]HET9031850.1 peptidoglycan editing factor PgeF [Dokdonella sp.]